MTVVLDTMASSISRSVGSTLFIRCRRSSTQHDDAWETRVVVQHDGYGGPTEDALTDWTPPPTENITNLLENDAIPGEGEAIDIKYGKLSDAQKARLLNDVTFEFELGTEDTPLPMR